MLYFGELGCFRLVRFFLEVVWEENFRLLFVEGLIIVEVVFEFVEEMGVGILMKGMLFVK